MGPVTSVIEDRGQSPHLTVLRNETAFSNNSGAFVDERLYCPWGQYWTQVGPTVEEVFAGMLGDQELWCAQYRRFSSNLGRCPAMPGSDLLGGNITNPQSLYRYAFVRNNPATSVDPSRLEPGGRGRGSDPLTNLISG